jgi:hypothetical protein
MPSWKTPLDAVDRRDPEIRPVAKGGARAPLVDLGVRRHVPEAPDEQRGREERDRVAEDERHVAGARVRVQRDAGGNRAERDPEVRDRPQERPGSNLS